MERQYKDSGVEWIGMIPETWEYKRFKYSGVFEKGKLPESSNIDNNGLPIIGASEMLGKAARMYTIDESVPQCKKDDILILWDGANAGITATGLEGVVSSTAVKYSCIDNSILSKYAAYILKHAEHYFKEKVTGTTIPHMNMAFINDFPLLFPPIYEQQRIADYLDKKCEEIDSLIRLQEQMIEKLKVYKQSVITEAVTKGLNHNAKLVSSGITFVGNVPEGWAIVPLRYLGRTQNGISKSGEYFGEGYPFVSYSDVYKNYSLPTKVTGLAKSTKQDQILFSVEEGDVFFTRTSETIDEIGFSSVCLNTIEKAVFAGFLIRFRPYKNKLNKNFSKYYFRSSIHRAFFVKEMNLVTRASLSQELLKSMPVLLPPLDEQQAIASFLDSKCSEIDKLIDVKQQKIEKLKDYKKSVIYEAVTGKINIES